VELSTKGWNWGEMEFGDDGNNMTFKVDGKRAFEIPINDVSRALLHSTGSGTKNDVSLEFHYDDTTGDDTESLVEIRFHIPASLPSADANDSGKSPAQVLADRPSIKLKLNTLLWLLLNYNFHTQYIHFEYFKNFMFCVVSEPLISCFNSMHYFHHCIY
jgi:hypothetical protein